MPTPPQPLSPRQLARIEAVHRGFLYQHLYCVACLLAAAEFGIQCIRVEKDEDFELVLSERTIYVQVKTRSVSISPSDISGTLDNFSKLRDAHSRGNRAGEASFVVVSNVAPSATLADRIADPSWPQDVQLLWPGRDPAGDVELPASWPNVAHGLDECLRLAGTIPSLAVSAECLVWKLAGRVQLSATGSPTHDLWVERLSDLFEQVVVQLQEFSTLPVDYEPITNEPPILSDERIRCITGFSGSGKTTWASMCAVHLPNNVAYFDVTHVPAAALPASLARDLTARFVQQENGDIGRILRPGNSGIEALRLLEQYLRARDVSPIVFLDNAHLLPEECIVALLRGARDLNFVLLAQPNTHLNTACAALGVVPEEMPGWDRDAVAREATSVGVTGDNRSCQRLLDLTGGLPLFVKSAMRQCVDYYQGSLDAMCRELESTEHSQATVQELLLSGQLLRLDEDARHIVRALSVAACPLEREEAGRLIRANGSLGQVQIAAGLRRLSSCRFLKTFGDGKLKLHDAVRVLGRSALAELEAGERANVHRAFIDVLAASLMRTRDVGRFSQLVQELGIVGDVETLVDLASDDMFHEMGVATEFREVLDAVANDETTPAELRYWAHDAIVFSQLQRGDSEGLDERLSEMFDLLHEHRMTARERVGFELKRMTWAAVRNQREEVSGAVANLLASPEARDTHLNIVLYNCSQALFRVGLARNAIPLIQELINTYMSQLGLSIEGITLASEHEIWELIDRDHTLNLKLLADCFDLLANCLNACEIDAGPMRIHAVKFYGMSGAFSSFFRVGQDLVDEVLGRGDREGALHFAESTLLPRVADLQMLDWMFPIRAQYAVLLAHNGRFDAARHELAALANHQRFLSSYSSSEFENQKTLVESLAHQQHSSIERG